ncbi:hypothetical protein [Micromonospora zamorensis]
MLAVAAGPEGCPGDGLAARATLLVVRRQGGRQSIGAAVRTLLRALTGR